jgi:hypothetical protein
MAPNEQELLREMPSGQNMLCLYPAMTKATDVEIFMQEAQAQAQMRLNSKIRLQ